MALAMLAVLLPAQGLMIARAAAPKDWTGYTPISTKEDLNNVRNNLTGKYYLTQDIVFTEADFAAGGAFYNEGEGWQPIGSEENPFSGTFDGNGHAIDGLRMGSEQESLGLFAYVQNGTITNLCMRGDGIQMEDYRGVLYVGSVAGYVSDSVIRNCTNMSLISALISPYHDSHIGGIIGYAVGSTISGCKNKAELEINSHSFSDVGGIVGYVEESTVSNCYNLERIVNRGVPPISMMYLYNYTGGIAGVADNSTIAESYNIGAIYSNGGEAHAGGIAGSGATISNCFNVGKISASGYAKEYSYASAGGIAGGAVSIQTCYNIGAVSASADNEVYAGGIAGRAGSVDNCYYLDNIQTGIGEGSGGAVSCTRNEMMQQGTFRGFDFNTVWTMAGDLGYSYPELVKTEMDSSISTRMKFPDVVFLKYVLDNFDTDGDQSLSDSECEAVTEIDVTNTSYAVEDITSLEGIQYFSNLKTLKCGGNAITSLDVGENSALTYLDCSSNRLTNLNVSKNSVLTHLDCSFNQLTNLDIGACAALTWLDCGSNKLNGLDVRKNTALVWLNCGTDWMDIYSDKNHITNLDVSNNSKLTSLNCECVGLESLDVSKNPALTYLNCRANLLASLDVSRNIALTSLDCSFNQLASLNVRGSTALTELCCGINELTSLDVSCNSALVTLDCYTNRLTSLDVSRNPALAVMDCSDNQITGLNLSGCPELVWLDCSSNKIPSLNLSQNTALRSLQCYGNRLTSLDLSKNTVLEAGEWNPVDIGTSTYSILVDEDRTADLSVLPGNFDGSKVSNLVGGTLKGNVLTVNAGVTEVTYTYDTGSDYPLNVTMEVIVAENPNGDVILRVYNPGNGKHHYTNGTQEANVLVAGGWEYEGFAWIAPKEGNPIYRVYNPSNDNHLYTMDAAERDALVDGGWNYEGILCYSAGSDGVPLYRVFNPYVTLNPHHYTDSLEECEFLESNGWKVEGISWYGLK